MSLIDKLVITILFFLLPNFSFEEGEQGSNNICLNKKRGCTFKITSNNPRSPMISTNILEEAIIGDYLYIYLIFPENIQKSFYLMAYDTSNNQNIIYKGDYYEIKLKKDNLYELRIFQKLKKNSYIQLLFLGLPENFVMEVEIQFELDFGLYISDLTLAGDNSLNSFQNKELLKYIDEMNKKEIEKTERLTQVREAIDSIVKIMFDTTIRLNYDELVYSEVMLVPPCFVLTISYKVGLGKSAILFFEPEKIQLSETKVINGKIDSHLDGLDILNGKKYIDSMIIRLLDLYNKNIKEKILNFGLEQESYIIIVSTNELNDCLVYGMRFFDDAKLENIIFEIEIKIEINNKMLENLAKNPQIVNAIDSLILEKNKKIIINGVIYALMINIVLDSDNVDLMLPF